MNAGDRMTARRWALAAMVSVAVPAALQIAGAPGLVTLGGVVVAALVVADVAGDAVRARRDGASARIARTLGDAELLEAHEALDRLTHGLLSEAESQLRDVLSSAGDETGAGPVRETLEVIEELERTLASTKSEREAKRDDVTQRLAGTPARTRQDDERSEDPMLLYQDDATIPGWIRNPRARDALRRIGAVLDDVRMLHDAQIEWAVLLFTLWSRALIVGGAPALGALSTGRVPLEGGFSARDVPWVLATAVAVLTMFTAPYIATTVMRRDAAGARLRRLLLIVEVPLCVTAIVLTPCWPVAVFASGWTNWWQRPVFNWLKLLAWIVALGAALAVGLLAADLSIWRLAVEWPVTLALVGITGGSYGAMLPISATMLVRVLFGGLVASQRARRVVDGNVDLAVRSLLRAAEAVEVERTADDLRIVARLLVVRADADDGWARRVPLGIAALVDDALARIAPPVGSAQATSREERAELARRPAPLTSMPVNSLPRALADTRLRSRKHAKSLSLLVVEIAREASRYGTGPLTATIRDDGEALVLRFANAIQAPLPPPGRGTGDRIMAGLRAALPGAKLTRGRVSGDWIDLPPSVTGFGVEVTLPRAMFTTG